jgi:hypothetical protein
MFIVARKQAIATWQNHLMRTTNPVDIEVYTECIHNYLNFNEANQAELDTLT